jgi:hypothetical protein
VVVAVANIGDNVPELIVNIDKSAFADSLVTLKVYNIVVVPSCAVTRI